MLHILWMIIKLILILLGIFLGIVVLFLLAVLFSPVRYQVRAQKDSKSMEAAGRGSWLLHLVSFRILYGAKGVDWDVRIFGISLLRVKAWLQKRKASDKKPKKRKETSSVPEDEPLLLEEEPLLCAEEEPVKPENEPLHAETSEEEDDSVNELLSLEGQTRSAFFSRVRRILTVIFHGIPNVFRGIRILLGRIKKGLVFVLGLPGRIFRALKNLSLTIRRFCDRINYWKEFLKDERTKGAIDLVKSEGLRLLRHICPRKIKGEVVFGLEDPALTGQILAGLGMTYPLHKNRIQVVPVFDRPILEGNVQCKGRVYGIALVITAWRLYFDKNVKYVWNRWNQKEG